MIIFSERVNGMYRDVRKAINQKEKSVVEDLVRQQVAGGADVIDINLGPTKGDPVENFVWLAQTVHEVTDKPLSLDSAKPDDAYDAQGTTILPDASAVFEQAEMILGVKEPQP